MKYLKLFEQFLLESIKFRLSNDLEGKINSITNKKKAKVIESFLVKSILTNFYNYINDETDRDIDKDYHSWNTQKKLDYFLNNPDEFLNSSFGNLIQNRYTRKLTSIIDYININNIDVGNFEELYQKSAQWHDELAKGVEPLDDSKKVVRRDETDNTDKFITYPNGWYWINLNCSYSEDEKDNMGHCGQDSGKLLFSLRDNNSNSHLTVSYNIEEKAMYQAKGRGNSKPLDKFHPYIIDLLLNEKYPINIILTGGYKPHLDFNLADLSNYELSSIISKKTQLEYTDIMFEGFMNNKKWEKVVAMVENGFEYDSSGEVYISDIAFFRFIILQKLDFVKYEDICNFELYNSSKEDVEFYVEVKGLEKFKKMSDFYKLWEYKIINNDDVTSQIEDLLIKDGKWYINHEFKGWAEFKFMFNVDDEVAGRNSYSSREYINQNMGEDTNLDFHYNFELTNIDLSYLTKETLIAIFEKYEEQEIKIEKSEIEELIESDEEYPFDTTDGYNYDELKDDIINNDDYSMSKLIEFLSLDSLDNIKNSIVTTYEMTQVYADEQEGFDRYIKILNEFFETDLEIIGSKLLIPFDINWGYLCDRVGHNTTNKKLFDILEGVFDTYVRDDAENMNIPLEDFPEWLEMKVPDNGFYGSIDKENLNSEVIDRLSHLS